MPSFRVQHPARPLHEQSTTTEEAMPRDPLQNAAIDAFRSKVAKADASLRAFMFSIPECMNESYTMLNLRRDADTTMIVEAIQARITTLQQDLAFQTITLKRLEAGDLFIGEKPGASS